MASRNSISTSTDSNATYGAAFSNTSSSPLVAGMMSTAPPSEASTAMSSGGRSRRAVRVAQASADAKLHSAFEKAAHGGAGDGNAFDYSASVGYSKAITQGPDAAQPGPPSGTDPTGGVSVTAYLQRMQRGGLIQSFGCLLVVQEGSFSVLAYSENAARMLGVEDAAAEWEQLQQRKAQATAAGGKMLHHDGDTDSVNGNVRRGFGVSLRSLSDKIRRSISMRGGSRTHGSSAAAEAEASMESVLQRSKSRSLWRPLPKGSHGGHAHGSAAAAEAKAAVVQAEPEPSCPPPRLEFGADALALFTPDSVAALRRAAAAGDVSMMNPLLVQAAVAVGRPAARRSFYAILHRIDAGLIMDLEPIQPDDDDVFTGEGALQAHRLAAKAIARLEKLPPGDLRLLCDTVVTEVRTLTGYDRVMCYKFHEDEHGEVLAEARRDTMEPYLGLHYPATDIPQAARFLFMKNRVRLIADAESDPVKVVHDEAQLPQGVVLAGSTMREVHGCHKQYMKNMGTLGSIGMAIIVNDAEAAQAQGAATPRHGDRHKRLWGLVVCHHETKRYVPYPLRLACEFLMQVFSLRVNMEMEMAGQCKEKDMLRVQTLLCDMLLRDAPVGIVAQYPNIMDLVKCDGAALFYAGQFWRLGATPTEMQLLDIVDWLQQSHAGASGFSTDSLAEAGYPKAEELGQTVCGMVAAQLIGNDYLFWFRGHVEKEVMWAGAKHSKGERDDGRKMHPRSSFAAFLEVVRQRSVPWDDVEIDAINSLQIILRGHMTAFNENDLRAMAAARLNDQDMDRASVAESEVSRLLETAMAPVFGVDAEGCVSAWNGAMAQLTGLHQGDALGRPLVHDLVCDQSKHILGWALANALKGQETQGLEIRLRRFTKRHLSSAASTMSSSSSFSSAASSRHSLSMASPLSQDMERSGAAHDSVVLIVNAFVTREEEGEGNGAVLGVCFVGQDLTAQKAVEGQFTKVQGDYEAIVHSGNSLIPPIFATDGTGLCTEWNPAMERVTGLARVHALGEVVLGQIFGQALRMKAEARTKLMIVLNKAISGVNTEQYPLAFLDSQGKLAEVLLTAQARRDSNGEVTGVFCFLHTASPELQAALKLQRAAEEVAEEKAKAVAYVRQEMKGPLDGIKYVRSKMGEWELNDDARDVWKTSVRCEQQLARLLDDGMENIEGLEEGFMVLEDDEYRLEDVFDTVAAMATQAARNTGVDMLCVPPQGLACQPPLAGDAVRLQQALAEFAVVAVQFTPRGGWVRLRLVTGGRALFSDNTALHCEFRISHSSATGVPDDMIRQMSSAGGKKNHQSQQQQKERQPQEHQCTQEGLGLSVARSIVLAMHGDIQYDRSTHEGRYEFVVRLALPYPIDSLSSSGAAPPSTTDRCAVSTSSYSQGLKAGAAAGASRPSTGTPLMLPAEKLHSTHQRQQLASH